MSLFKKPEPEEHCGSGLDKAPKKTVTEKLKDAIEPLIRPTGNGTVQKVPQSVEGTQS